MADSETATTADKESRPWQQELYDSIWLLAGAAIVFFVLSYVVWGLVDLLTVPMGV